MRDFVIVTDSSCDLPANIIKEYEIVVVPMTTTINNNTYKHYHDYRELSKEDYYNALRNESTGSTAGVNTYDAFEIMKSIVLSNKDIIYLSLSSGLSCSYQNAVLATEDLVDEFPDTRIKIIDTKSVCVGVGMLLLIAAEAKRKGSPFDEVVAIVYENIKKIKHSFTVNDLSALRRSGRISATTATVGSMLSIKPMLDIDPEGKVRSVGKVRGRKAAIKQLVDNAIKNAINTNIFVIGHADAISDAEAIRKSLSDVYPNCKVVICDIGPVIGVHVGIETLALIYIGG